MQSAILMALESVPFLPSIDRTRNVCKKSDNDPKTCAVATAQIVWPSPFPCGDQALTNKILASLNQLAPPGGVRSFHDKCGTSFFTASLTPAQIQQLMGEDIGIEFIAPDEDVKNDVESVSDDVGKRALPDFGGKQENRLLIARPSRLKTRALPDFIRVTSGSPYHLAYISSPANYQNPNNDYAWFDSVGDRVNIYWIDAEFYPLNSDLEEYTMPEHQLMAEYLDTSGDRPESRLSDHGGCMLSIVGGRQYGVVRREMQRPYGVQLSIVKVNKRVSSFLSGLQAIITELERRTRAGDEFINGWTVIGTALVVQNSQSGILVQAKATALFKRLLTQFGVVFVVAAGNIRGEDGRALPVSNNNWPASFALNPETPIIVAGAVQAYSQADLSYSEAFSIIHAPSRAICRHGQVDKSLRGTSPATAIVTGLAADMLSRGKVRNKLYIDLPELAPEEERLQANRLVSAKIRDYLDEKSYDRMGSRLYGAKGVWNGLDPRNPDIASYQA